MVPGRLRVPVVPPASARRSTTAYDASDPSPHRTGRPPNHAQPVVPDPGRPWDACVGQLPGLVSLPFEGDEEPADVRRAFVLVGVDRFIVRRVKASADEIRQERAANERVQMVAQPGVVDEPAIVLAADEILLGREAYEKRVSQSTGEVAPVVGHAMVVLARSQGGVGLI
jgi:hypothetical protein